MKSIIFSKLHFIISYSPYCLTHDILFSLTSIGNTVHFEFSLCQSSNCLPCHQPWEGRQFGWATCPVKGATTFSLHHLFSFHILCTSGLELFVLHPFNPFIFFTCRCCQSDSVYAGPEPTILTMEEANNNDNKSVVSGMWNKGGDLEPEPKFQELTKYNSSTVPSRFIRSGGASLDSYGGAQVGSDDRYPGAFFSSPYQSHTGQYVVNSYQYWSVCGTTGYPDSNALTELQKNG